MGNADGGFADEVACGGGCALAVINEDSGGDGGEGGGGSTTGSFSADGDVAATFVVGGVGGVQLLGGRHETKDVL